MMPAIAICVMLPNGRPSTCVVNHSDSQPARNAAARCAQACAKPPTRRYHFEWVSVKKMIAATNISSHSPFTGSRSAPSMAALKACDSEVRSSGPKVAEANHAESR